uniref:Uncharacterized protein n=1 Tax=Aegilops tauschii subsp. strangulata TaxID=200361 RepID=A0A453LGS9_AEGTS
MEIVLKRYRLHDQLSLDKGMLIDDLDSGCQAGALKVLSEVDEEMEREDSSIQEKLDMENKGLQQKEVLFSFHYDCNCSYTNLKLIWLDLDTLFTCTE